MKPKEAGFILLLCAFPLAGCASPIDFLFPTKRMAPTALYLGQIKCTATNCPYESVMLPKINGMYHSLADTKLETKLLDPRKALLDAQYNIAKTGNGFVTDTFDPISNGLWGLILAGAAAMGWMAPSPREKGKVMKAGLTDAEEFKNSC